MKAILAGGLLCGVLDITYAIVFSALRGGRSPLGVLQSVAAGALGKSAFQGGLPTAALGLLFHFVIAFGAATTYWLLSRKIAFLKAHPIVSGAVFGLGVYAFMNMVVIPLSALQVKFPYPARILIPGLIAHVLFVGLPISLSNKYAE